MPANLTPQYLKAEEEYRRAATLEEELKWLQIMLQEIPKHKGTDHLQAAGRRAISCPPAGPAHASTRPPIPPRWACR